MLVSFVLAVITPAAGVISVACALHSALTREMIVNSNLVKRASRERWKPAAPFMDLGVFAQKVG
jgi:hypothetical protein